MPLSYLQFDFETLTQADVGTRFLFISLVESNQICSVYHLHLGEKLKSSDSLIAGLRQERTPKTK